MSEVAETISEEEGEPLLGGYESTEYGETVNTTRQESIRPQTTTWFQRVGSRVAIIGALAIPVAACAPDSANYEGDKMDSASDSNPEVLKKIGNFELKDIWTSEDNVELRGITSEPNTIIQIVVMTPGLPDETHDRVIFQAGEFQVIIPFHQLLAPGSQVKIASEVGEFEMTIPYSN